jgi:hypothetical protein
MGRLLTSVIVVEAGKMTLQVMGIHGLQQALGDRFATRLRNIAHLAPPSARCPCHISSRSSDLILQAPESFEQERMQPSTGRSIVKLLPRDYADSRVLRRMVE